ncbi:hypothetical protein K502DRAFT_167062 [Neoconidiobolus thromboides FSU 785]|nr:hypothetical protein K502DRAFT_167062 [Neoconidiobolus thromboides FSU 785]
MTSLNKVKLSENDDDSILLPSIKIDDRRVNGIKRPYIYDKYLIFQPNGESNTEQITFEYYYNLIRDSIDDYVDLTYTGFTNKLLTSKFYTAANKIYKSSLTYNASFFLLKEEDNEDNQSMLLPLYTTDTFKKGLSLIHTLSSDSPININGELIPGKNTIPDFDYNNLGFDKNLIKMLNKIGYTINPCLKNIPTFNSNSSLILFNYYYLITIVLYLLF